MNSIKTGLFYNTLNSILRIIFPLVTAPYVARVLAPEDLGLYHFGATYAGYFSLVALLGIPYYGVREIAKVSGKKSDASKLLSELLSIVLLNTVILSSLYTLSIFLFEKFNSNYTIFLIVGISLYCSPFNIDWFFRGLEDFKHLTIRSIIIKLLGIVLLFICVRTRDDLVLYVLLSAFTTVVSDIWNFIVLYKKGYRVSIRLNGLSKHMRPLLILFATTIATSIYTMLDSLMLGFLSEYSQVAFYSYAVQAYRILLVIITSMSAVALPRVSSYIENGSSKEVNDLINKSLSLVIFLSFPLCVCILMCSPIFIPLFLGNAYTGTVIPMQILSVQLVLIGLNDLFAVQCLIAWGFDKFALYSVLCGTITNFLLNICLIPNYGAIGASIASVIAEGFVLLASYLFVRRNIGILFKNGKEYIRTALACLLFIPIYMLGDVYLSGPVLLVAFLIVSASSYLVIQYYVRNQSLLIVCSIIQNKILGKKYKVRKIE